MPTIVSSGGKRICQNEVTLLGVGIDRACDRTSNSWGGRPASQEEIEGSSPALDGREVLEEALGWDVSLSPQRQQVWTSSMLLQPHWGQRIILLVDIYLPANRAPSATTTRPIARRAAAIGIKPQIITVPAPIFTGNGVVLASLSHPVLMAE